MINRMLYRRVFDDDHHVQVIDGPQANSAMNEFRKQMTK